jgi:hypothetical protein
MDTVNELIMLYSKAIEYYNGMQDEKYTYFESRIQNLLIRPEVLLVMSKASRNPQKYASEAERKRQQQAGKTEQELMEERLKQAELRKKERI